MKFRPMVRCMSSPRTQVWSTSLRLAGSIQRATSLVVTWLMTTLWESQPTLTRSLYPAEEALLIHNLNPWDFTREQLRPGQATQCGSILVEMTDSYFTMVRKFKFFPIKYDIGNLNISGAWFKWVEVFLPDISFQTGPKIVLVGFYQKIFKGCFLPDTSFQTRKVGSSQPDKTLSGRFHPKIFFLMDSSRHLSWLFNPIFSFGGSLQTTNIPHPMS